jgi:hypothetical protein
MRWRFIPFLLVMPAIACGTSSLPTALSDDATRAKALIGVLEHDPDHFHPFVGTRWTDDIITMELDRAHMSRAELLSGCLELLKRGTPDMRANAARLLGKLKDPAVIAPLMEALADADEDVRRRACYALDAAGAKGKAFKEALVRLCRTDPSVPVRVAAADVLDDPDNEDTTAAFRLGLQSDKSWLWETCEDQLEKRGKLELPLPEHVYAEISHERYQDIKAGRGGIDGRFRREMTKDGTIYQEAYTDGHHMLVLRRWYRTKADQGGGERPE